MTSTLQRFNWLFLLLVFVLLLLICKTSQAASPFFEPGAEDSQKQLDEVIASCVQAKYRDEVCNYLITLKNVGDDAIELIKDYAQLGPRQYLILTLLNYAATGRLRYRFVSPFDERAVNIIDIQRDRTTIYHRLEF